MDSLREIARFTGTKNKIFQIIKLGEDKYQNKKNHGPTFMDY